jgi:alkaline phosphatase D
VLSGDVHLHYAADLKMDFANPKSATVGVELTNTSITSGGDGRHGRADVGSHPPATTRTSLTTAPGAGYVACTATPASLRADFKILESRLDAGSPVRVGGSLVVEAGRPGVSRT